MSVRNLPGGKWRPMRKADNLAAICEPTVKKFGSLDISQPCGCPLPFIRIASQLYIAAHNESTET
jgi:hypothetical protein